MQLNELTAISPVDGRYISKTNALAEYFSEYGLIQYRVQIEVEYLIFLNAQKMAGFDTVFNEQQINALRNLYLQFNEGAALWIKHTEKTTNHDVKAVEYYLKDQMDKMGLSAYREWVHFGLTSQDINNTAIPLSIKDALHKVVLPSLQKLIQQLEAMAIQYEAVPMLAKTHGQAASPTKLGKEIMVFVARLKAQYQQLLMVPFSAKFGGATGNFNAHHVAFPAHDWQAFGNAFVNQVLGLDRSFPTTQIEHYDNLAAMCDAFKRIHTILIDLCHDIWQYISMDYFKQQLKAGEVGSSAMPHKVNPIDFENSEGNLGLANALLRHMAEKLPISRWQRDLTDSTVLRNMGVAFGYTLLAYDACLRGLNKLEINPEKLAQDLDASWEVLAEPIQTVMRRYGIANPYEQLKELTRGKGGINQASLHAFIQDLAIPAQAKQDLLAMTPASYIGKAVALAKRS
jgi:adenylosuccinate lyase